MNSISNSTIDFLRDLAENNNPIWFEQNRNRYEEARADFKFFIEKLLSIIAKDWNLDDVSANDIVSELDKETSKVEGKKTYKTYLEANITPQKKPTQLASFTIRIDPTVGSKFIAGFNSLDLKSLNLIRKKIAQEPEQLQFFLKTPAFKRYFMKIKGSKLDTVPAGFNSNHPNMDLLRYQTFQIEHLISNRQIKTRYFLEYTEFIFGHMQTFCNFFNEAITEAA